MRLNFTGRRKIQKQHAPVSIPDDPVGSRRGHYADLQLDLSEYKLPPDARIIVEASRKFTLMRFEWGTVGSPAALSPAQRRLSDFGPSPEGIKFRIKVVQPDGPEAGKLLAEADGLTPGGGDGTLPLIRVAGDSEMGETPWRLELAPTDADLPVLYINTAIGGKTLADDPKAGPLLMTAAVREVFAALVRDASIDPDDEEHWATLWSRFAHQVLEMQDPEEVDGNDGEAVREWVEEATRRFADRYALTRELAAVFATIEMEELEDVN